MATLKEANHARAGLKMKLSRFWWYSASEVLPGKGDYYIVVIVKQLNNFVRKHIPSVINGVSIKSELG